MEKTVAAVCTALEALSAAVLAATVEDRTMLDIWGWNYPSVTRQDLALIPKQLAQRLRAAAPDTVDKDLEARLSALPVQIASIQSQTVPHLYDGNGLAASAVYLDGLTTMEKILEPLLGWPEIDSNTLPPKMAKRLRTINAQLDELTPDKDELQNQIALINAATEAADSLPVDLQELDIARKRVEKAAASSEALFAKLVGQEKTVTTAVGAISDHQKEAAALVSSCEEAYRITTTKGLSAAFQQRATSLGRSVWSWVLLLFGALATGSFLGYHRIGIITEALSRTNPNLGVLWLQFALSVLSVGAPFWFAWLATKQIGQRFRLAEDYAFKASVAKAYEGYRREAARIDPDLEKRLFASALDRLDEAPLRLVEHKTHGGPWSEFLDSKAVGNALDVYPDLRDRIYKIGAEAVKKLGSNSPQPAADLEPLQP